MKSKAAIILTKCSIISLSALVMGLGVSLVIKANIGADPIDVFMQAVSFRTGLPLGAASMLFSVALVAGFYAAKPSRVGIGTVLQAVVVGVGIDLSNLFVAAIPNDLTLWQRIPLCALGALIIGVCVAVYLPCDLGVSPIDLAILFARDHLKGSFKLGLFLVYAILMVLGIVLGGVWGIGTVIAMTVTGFSADYLLRVFTRLYARWFPVPQTEPSES